MFLDCCRTQMNFHESAPSLGFPRARLPDSPFGVGHASRRGTKAFEEPEHDPTSRGVFSRVLIEGLRRRRDDNHLLTLNELENYVYAGVPQLLRGRKQYPQFEFERNPPYPLVTGPALPQSIPIIVTFSTLAAGTQVQLVDSNGTPVGAPIAAGPRAVMVHAEAGKLYSLETSNKTMVKAFKHDGPGATNVDL